MHFKDLVSATATHAFWSSGGSNWHLKPRSLWCPPHRRIAMGNEAASLMLHRSRALTMQHLLQSPLERLSSK